MTKYEEVRNWLIESTIEKIKEDKMSGADLDRLLEKLKAEFGIECEEASRAAGVESHSEKKIYEGCLRLIRQVINYFDEYLDCLDIHQEDLLEEERFSIALSNFEIVQNLFLYGTGHSGGTSTRKKCRELGLDDSDLVEFGFSREDDDEL